MNVCWRRLTAWTRNVVAVWMLGSMLSNSANAYSVLTHEEIIDMQWEGQIKPLLRQRFPNLTSDDIKEAHAYAYGGAVIQDLGYYPFGNKYFSDLVHYVRSGDFVSRLIADSQDPKEYAFALGALAHYAADVSGHPAVNRSVAILYPKLERKFGTFVTYDQSKAAHLDTEFGFDVLQVAKQRFNFDQYHAFIGFEVAQRLLAQAFQETYGLKFDDVIKHQELAIGTYRWSVHKVIPQMTKVAIADRGKEMNIPERDDAAKRKYLYHLSRADYEREYGTKYARPGFGAKVLAVLLKLVPKVGPFKGLQYKNPTPQTEDLYIKSIDATIALYSEELAQLRQDPASIKLQNRDFDTGKVTAPGEYRLTDETHARLTRQLQSGSFKLASAPLMQYLRDYFHGPDGQVALKERRDFEGAKAIVDGVPAFALQGTSQDPKSDNQ